MRRIRDLKLSAKIALKGNYGTVILGGLAATGVGVLGNMLTSVLFPGYSTLEIILSQIFSIIMMLVLSVFTAGFSHMLLNVARGKEYSFGDMFHFFKNHPDRVIVASTVLAVLDVLVSLPMICYGLMTEPGEGVEAQLAWLSTYALLMLLAAALKVIFSIPFAMMYLLLADNADMSGMEALKESVRMMKGKIGKYLLLQLSFIPLLIFSIFTLYVALLWIIPYIEMTTVMFYRDITGEMDAVPQIETVPSYYNLVQRQDELNEDDDNSEA